MIGSNFICIIEDLITIVTVIDTFSEDEVVELEDGESIVMKTRKYLVTDIHEGCATLRPNDLLYCIDNLDNEKTFELIELCKKEVNSSIEINTKIKNKFEELKDIGFNEEDAMKKAIELIKKKNNQKNDNKE